MTMQKTTFKSAARQQDNCQRDMFWFEREHDNCSVPSMGEGTGIG